MAMPGSGPLQQIKWTFTWTTGADLSTKQWHGVYIDTNGNVVAPASSNGDEHYIIGVLQNKPKSGQEAEVLICGQGRIVAAEAIAVGSRIRIGNDGKAYLWESTDNDTLCIGICTSFAATADGNIIEAIFNCVGPFGNFS